MIEVVVRKSNEKYTTKDKTNNRINTLHFNDKGELWCVQLLNGKWITAPCEITFIKKGHPSNWIIGDKIE